MSVNVVWFKRDLRLNDNAAISDAIKRNLPIICLFNLDSQRIARPDVSAIHIEWELDCLRSLSKDIHQLGGVIKFNYGNIFEALEKLNLELTRCRKTPPSRKRRYLLASGKEEPKRNGKV